jgi:hypothetical protein
MDYETPERYFGSVASEGKRCRSKGWMVIRSRTMPWRI